MYLLKHKIPMSLWFQLYIISSPVWTVIILITCREVQAFCPPVSDSTALQHTSQPRAHAYFPIHKNVLLIIAGTDVLLTSPSLLLSSSLTPSPLLLCASLFLLFFSAFFLWDWGSHPGTMPQPLSAPVQPCCSSSRKLWEVHCHDICFTTSGRPSLGYH